MPAPVVAYAPAAGTESAANVVPLNDADDRLHLGLGAATVILGLVGCAARAAR